MSLLQEAEVTRLVNFIIERHKVYLARKAGKPKPWTADPMLRAYKFTNVYRELDRVTVWIAENWRSTYVNDCHLWFAMVVARLVNWPDTLEAISSSVFTTKGRVKWDQSKFVSAMHSRKDAGLQVFSGAYIVSTNGRSMDKAEYLVEHVLTPLWDARSTLLCVPTLDALHKWLMKFNGMGSFMAAQVVADLKYTPLWETASDWHTWAASGPGSRRGLNIVCGRAVGAPMPEHTWLATLQALRAQVNVRLPKGWEKLHAQDLQNCLCEFSKYTRGYSRTKFQGI